MKPSFMILVLYSFNIGGHRPHVSSTEQNPSIGFSPDSLENSGSKEQASNIMIT